MELNYSGAKTLDEARAIKKAYWDEIHRQVLAGQWQEITREEFFRQLEEARQRIIKKKQQQDGKADDIPLPA